MKKTLQFLVGISIFILSSWTHAAIGTIDKAPAATLLFPHFEVDTTTSNRVSTVITIQNASATAILANVVLWTDYGIPTKSFNVYLTGYDQETVNLADVILRGFTPRTASAGQDPGDNISNRGPFSQDINFASCNATLPDPQSTINTGDLRLAHTGQASIDYFAGQCGARNYNDGIARGYVTVDTCNQCTQQVPGDPGYISGIITYQNVLLGEYTILDRSRNRFLTESAVHVEADQSNPITASGANKQTFYARLTGYNADDHREPLPTAFAARTSNGRTDVDYWRDPGVPVATFACGGTPAPFPMGQRLLTAFGANGGVVSNPSGNQFPYATGSALGSGTLGLSQPLGWLFSNLNLPVANGPLGSIRQSWMNFRQVPSSEAAGSTMGYSVPGVQLGNAATGADIILP